MIGRNVLGAAVGAAVFVGVVVALDSPGVSASYPVPSGTVVSRLAPTNGYPMPTVTPTPRPTPNPNTPYVVNGWVWDPASRWWYEPTTKRWEPRPGRKAG